MVQFQKLTINLFLTLHWHNVHRQQRQLSKFLMRCQQFAFHVYCWAAGPVSKMAPQQEKAFCVLRFEVSRSVITVQCSAVHGLEKTHRAWGVFSNHKSGNLKIEYTESLFLLRHHLGDWPSGPAVSMRSELLVAHEKLGQLLLLLKPHNFLCVPCILFFILIILTK